MNFNRIALEKIQKDRLDLAVKKNIDYSSVVDVIGTTGVEGIAVRLFDKASRLLSLIKNKNAEVKDESIRDTLKDIGNYADFGVSLLDHTWGDSSNSLPPVYFHEQKFPNINEIRYKGNFPDGEVSHLGLK